MDNWQRVSVTSKIEACRTGWFGVWDALCAAVTGDARTTVAKDVTVSVLIKGDCLLSLTQEEH